MVKTVLLLVLVVVCVAVGNFLYIMSSDRSSHINKRSRVIDEDELFPETDTDNCNDEDGVSDIAATTNVTPVVDSTQSDAIGVKAEIEKLKLLLTKPTTIVATNRSNEICDDGEIKQFLIRNSTGVIIRTDTLAREEPDESSIVASQVLVVSTVAGAGRRRQGIDNIRKQFCHGAICSSGFALASDDLIEFHYFSSVSVVAKSWWARQYPCEKILGIALGLTQLLVATTEALYFYGHSGRIVSIIKPLPGDLSSISSDPTKDLFLLSFAQPERSLIQIYRGTELETIGMKLSMPSWTGFSPLGVPIFCCNDGEIIGLFPIGKEKRPVPLGYIPHINNKTWIVEATDDTIIFCKLTHKDVVLEDISTELLEPVVYRLNLGGQVVGLKPVPQKEYNEAILADLAFKTSSDLTAEWSWVEFDEVAVRLSYWRAHILTEIARAEEEKNYTALKGLQAALKSNKMISDRVSLRIFLRSANDGRNELALAAVQSFLYQKTFQVAVNHARSQGYRALTELLETTLEDTNLPLETKENKKPTTTTTSSVASEVQKLMASCQQRRPIHQNPTEQKNCLA